MSFLRTRVGRFCSALVACLMLMTLLVASVAHAHEFWLDPMTFRPSVGVRVPIVIRSGVDFKGDTFPFLRVMNQGFAIIDRTGSRSIKAIDGDDPAGEALIRTDGLAIVWHRRRAEAVDFKSIEEFEDYLKDEGLEAIGVEHRAQRRPAGKITELYSRCAKTLLRTGAALTEADRAVGMPLELVVDDTASGADARVRVRVLLDGKPFAGALIKLFGPQQSLQKQRTDANGDAAFAVSQPGEYMAASVSMRRARAGERADYVSQWSSTTFARQ